MGGVWARRFRILPIESSLGETCVAAPVPFFRNHANSFTWLNDGGTEEYSPCELWILTAVFLRLLATRELSFPLHSHRPIVKAWYEFELSRSTGH